MKIGSLVKNKILQNRIIKSLLIIAIITFISCNTSEQSEVFTFGGSTMGTTYSIKIVNSYSSLLKENFQMKIDSLLYKVNMQMSTYIKDSEISLFNSFADTNWFSVSGELAQLIHYANEVAANTNYTYDITIGPVVNLWGFGPNTNSVEIPSDERILQTKKLTGIDKIIVDTASSKIKKTKPDIYCDLSSIAKGYGVDKVGLMLEEHGFNDYMVEIGGEVRTKGRNSKNGNWKIGISSPNSNGLQKVVSISGVSVATSGDYLNYFENEGVRYSHLIDPRIGKPITHNLASVTVIADECSTADAFATAINVLGPDDGYKFALENKLPIFMIVRKKNNFVEKMTPQFEKFIEERN